MDQRIEQVGEAIRFAREKLGLTQIEFAKRLGASQGTISQWERGDIDIPYSTLCRIADALEIPVAKLCDRNARTSERSLAEMRIEGVKKVISGSKDDLSRFIGRWG